MEVTLLELEQVDGVYKTIFPEGRLEIFKKYGMTAVVTDFAKILGNLISRYKTFDGNLGAYWLKTIHLSAPYIIFENGSKYVTDPRIGYIGIRPVLSFSEIESNYPFKVIKKEEDILEIEFGYYPQTAASKEIQAELEDVLIKRNISETGNMYTVEARTYDSYYSDFWPCNYHEYEYKEEKYIRAKATSDCIDYNRGDVVWIKVEPIQWLVDLKTDLATTKKIMTSGIKFDFEEYVETDFEETVIYKYLNNYFIKDITQNIKKNEIKVKVEYEKSKQEIELENIEKAKQKILELKSKIK